MDGAELGEGVDDVVCAVAAEGGGFILCKQIGFGGAVGIGKDYFFWGGVLEGNGVEGGVVKTAGGAGEFFTGFGEAFVDGFALEQTLGSAIGAIDLYL